MALDIEIGKKAKIAAIQLANTSITTINNALNKLSKIILENKESIIKANIEDVEKARKAGMKEVMIDRLSLNDQRLQGMANNLLLVENQESPINKVVSSYQSPSGFEVITLTVPLGVIGMIYEARPNVTTEALALSLKSQNALILRGSASALNTNKAIINALRKEALKLDLPQDFVQLIQTTSHDDIIDLARMDEYVDVIIPRGGAALIKNVVQNGSVPVIETGTGNNFAYVSDSADFEKAIDVIINAKASRVSVCNSLEKVLIDKDVLTSFYTMLNNRLKEYNIKVHCDKNLIPYFDNSQEFKEEDYDLEYLDYEIGIKIVDSIDEAIKIMNKYSSKHSNLILSNDYTKIEKFKKEVDAACVYVNVSTRFSDGEMFGLGSEIGISTQKIHARGPMGAAALTSTKSVINGSYQERK
ncbi:glutamate-5-semialdehyde dehydrogenase [Mycoplasma sp. P36-A1]|uniref:glutamate-5-semialdehyde dehydrogenase n=1 Tax=Mycoplasma sp. P36-A1 TaxID=3252900 RepID=UPI003C2CC733